MQALIAGYGPVDSETFEVGRDVAVTPGKNVFRNQLVEPVQNTPARPYSYEAPDHMALPPMAQ